MKISFRGETVHKLIQALHHFKDRNPKVTVYVDQDGTHDTIRVTGDGYADPDCTPENPDYPYCLPLNDSHRCPPFDDCP